MTDEHARATIGLTGLATMGRNLARNIARHGHTIAAHNRTTARPRDGLRRDRSPAALIQALRDNVGAHTYERVDREGTFHTRWGATDRVEESAR